MRDIVLMPLMGHSDFNTTRKYYIVVTRDLKLNELNKVYDTDFDNTNVKSPKINSKENDFEYLLKYAKIISELYDNMIKEKQDTTEENDEIIEDTIIEKDATPIDAHLLQFINQNALLMKV